MHTYMALPAPRPVKKWVQLNEPWYAVESSWLIVDDVFSPLHPSVSLSYFILSLLMLADVFVGPIPFSSS